MFRRRICAAPFSPEVTKSFCLIPSKSFTKPLHIFYSFISVDFSTVFYPKVNEGESLTLCPSPFGSYLFPVSGKSLTLARFCQNFFISDARMAYPPVRDPTGRSTLDTVLPYSVYLLTISNRKPWTFGDDDFKPSINITHISIFSSGCTALFHYHFFNISAVSFSPVNCLILSLIIDKLLRFL